MRKRASTGTGMVKAVQRKKIFVEGLNSTGRIGMYIE